MVKERLPFRPLDNSSSTRLGYDLEVNHWLKSLKSAQATSGSSLSIFGFVGLFISIFVNLFFIIIILLSMFFQWLFKPKKNSTRMNTNNHTPYYTDDTDEEMLNLWDD